MMQKDNFGRKTLFRFFGCLVFSILFLTQINAQNNSLNGIVYGMVSSNDGKDAPNVNVQISNLKKSVLTDDKGMYKIEHLPSGIFDIEIFLPGYQKQVKTFTIQPGSVVQLNFKLDITSRQLEDIIVSSTKRKFGIDNSETVAKIPLSNLENSQVYTTISKSLIADQMVYSVDDAMRNAPGVQTMWAATGRAGDGGAYYNSRGFTMQSTLRNGIAGVVTDAIDAANLETLEVIKGPSATLFGSTLTSYGGLINRVTKKPFDHFGGNVSMSLGSYQFGRGSIDINSPLDKKKQLLFRLNGAYNNQGSFQTEGFSKRYFVAPSLLYKPSEKLSISLDAELSYGKNQVSPYLFFYYPVAQLGVTNAKQINMDYKNAYVGDGMYQTSNSANYFGQVNYKISKSFTSSTNFSYGQSYSNGRAAYFYLVPNTTDINNYYLARADQSTRNGKRKTLEIQQNFNGDFKIGSVRNRIVLGLDYTRLNANILFYYPSSYFDIVPLSSGYDYSTMNGVSLNNYYDTSSTVGTYPSISITNTYSAYISDVINLTDRFNISAGVRVDRFNINDQGSNQKYNQTVFSPKFGAVYQIIKDQVSIFANYQNGFTNKNTYTAYKKGQQDSLVTVIAKPEQANQWEAGFKTDLIKNRVSASLSYYDITVKNTVRADPNLPALASVQNGTQVSRGVELQLSANVFDGFNFTSGISYNDSKYTEADSTVLGRRPTTASSPWQANWWMSYRISNGVLNGLRIGFGGNYANNNEIVNSTTMGVFYLPSYLVLNSAITYETNHLILGLKVDNLTNKHYWTGYTTMNPQMLRQLVASVSYKF
ncbi:TonB-dependent receptor [Rhizosphaericola mali]|uniref:TonB-dependent receptor n=2 Tax=Rhizosphaericola mali TaxID=2545455 RepID=A0A5P2G9P5_9BACT|nr:TonB-dependent receptor [Rhizosphaericola mali]